MTETLLNSVGPTFELSYWLIFSAAFPLSGEILQQIP